MDKTLGEDGGATGAAASATSPVLTEPSPDTSKESVDQLNKPEKRYSSFTRKQIWLLVALVSVAATLSGFAGNIYFPALPSLASDFGVSYTLINLTITSYMILQAIAPSFWGAIADVHGRRPAFIATFVVFLAACIGLANARNYATLIVLRCLQSAGSASTIAIGAGVVGDLTTRAERGGFMGIFQAGLLVPVALAPVIGGILGDTLGWRSIFWFLVIYGGAVLVLLAIALPETLRSIVGDGSLKQPNFLYRYPLSLYQRYQATPDAEMENEQKLAPKKHIDLLGPFRILIDKRAVPIVVFLSIHYTVWQMGVATTSTLFSSIYHLDELQIGLTYIANGAGSMLGTLTTGKLLDIHYRRVKTSFDAQKVSPEGLEGQTCDEEFPLERARLQLAPMLSLLECVSVLIFGWTLDYHVHIAVPIVMTFINGWAAVSIQSMTMTYLVDVFLDSSASASAACNFARCILGAAGTAVVDPMILGLGIGGCFTLLTGLMLLGLAALLIQTWIKDRRRQTPTRASSTTQIE